MSIREAETYFKESSERSVSLTDGTGVWWWLRSPGFEGNNAAKVGDYGIVNKARHKVFDDYVVNGGFASGNSYYREIVLGKRDLVIKNPGRQISPLMVEILRL